MLPEERVAGGGSGADGVDDPVRWGMGDALLGTLLTIVVPAVVVLPVLAATGRDQLRGIPLWAVALLQVPLWAGLLGAPLWSSFAKGRRSLAADFGLRMRWTDVPLGLAAGLGAQVLLLVLITALYRVLGIDIDKVGISARELTAAATDAVGVVLLVVIVAVAAPVFEELFYRGLWLRAVERRWGKAWAVVVSSLVFGAIHFQIYDFAALVGFGIVAAVLTVRTGRLGPAIWAHVAFNLTAVVTLLAGSGPSTAPALWMNRHLVVTSVAEPHSRSNGYAVSASCPELPPLLVAPRGDLDGPGVFHGDDALLLDLPVDVVVPRPDAGRASLGAGGHGRSIGAGGPSPGLAAPCAHRSHR